VKLQVTLPDIGNHPR